MRIVTQYRRRESVLPNLWILLFAAVVGAAGYYGLSYSGAALPRLDLKSERFGACSYVSRDNCVIDGDTFVLSGEKIRIADIDAPETGGAKCASEAELGARATKRLRELLNQGPFELRSYQSRDRDQYGRKLRVVMRDGRSVGDTLITEGLARRWNGKRSPWCA
jgi:endonuclease YncB( thermonuclease family)